MLKENIETILSEITSVVSKIEPDQIDFFTEDILKANKIVVCGAGRVGLAAKGFAMRLGHLGLSSWALGDMTVPSIGDGDLLIVASGSGETQTIFDITKIAHSNGSRIAAITGNENSRIAALAHRIIVLRAPSKTKSINNMTSIQPMTTLNEQCLQIIFDATCLELMRKLSENHDSMWNRHSNLE